MEFPEVVLMKRISVSRLSTVVGIYQILRFPRYHRSRTRTSLSTAEREGRGFLLKFVYILHFYLMKKIELTRNLRIFTSICEQQKRNIGFLGEFQGLTLWFRNL
jgi:hypothetical protein